jgi:hypothetical protein
MRKGQSVLEYVFLIGVGAAALIVMLVYIGRGLQGNLRNQAEQLGAQQYSPGKTTMHNIEIKEGNDNSSLGSSTTTVHGNTAQDQNKSFTVDGVEYKSLVSLKNAVVEAKNKVLEKQEQYQALIVSEGKTEAAGFSGAGSYPGFAGYDGSWKMPGGLEIKMGEINSAITDYNLAVEKLNAAYAAWNGSFSSESGNSTITKIRNEVLGDL